QRRGPIDDGAARSPRERVAVEVPQAQVGAGVIEYARREARRRELEEAPEPRTILRPIPDAQRVERSQSPFDTSAPPDQELARRAAPVERHHRRVDAPGELELLARRFQPIFGELERRPWHEHDAAGAHAGLERLQVAEQPSGAGQVDERLRTLLEQAQQHLRKQQDREIFLVVARQQRLDIEVEQLRDRAHRHRLLRASDGGDRRLASDQEDAHRPLRLMATKRGDQRARARERPHRGDRDYLHQASSRRSSPPRSRRSVSAVRTSSRTRSSRRSICSVWRLRSCSNSAASRSRDDAVAIRRDRRRAYAGATRQSARRASPRARPGALGRPPARIFAVIGSEAVIGGSIMAQCPARQRDSLGWLMLRRRAMTLNELPNTPRPDESRSASVLIAASGEPEALRECLAAVHAQASANVVVAEVAPDASSVNRAAEQL